MIHLAHFFLFLPLCFFLLSTLLHYSFLFTLCGFFMHCSCDMQIYPWDLFIHPKLFIRCVVKCLWECLFVHLPNQWLCPPPIPSSSTSFSNSFSFIPKSASSLFYWFPLKFQCLTAHLVILVIYGVNMIRCWILYLVISGELELLVLLSLTDNNMRDSGAVITESTYKKKVKTSLMAGKCITLTVITERSQCVYIY